MQPRRLHQGDRGIRFKSTGVMGLAGSSCKSAATTYLLGVPLNRKRAPRGAHFPVPDPAKGPEHAFPPNERGRSCLHVRATKSECNC